MRPVAIAELAGSLLIVTMTGLYAFGGLALTFYCLLAFSPRERALAMIPLVFGALNLPVFVGWCRQTAIEAATWAPLFSSSQKGHVATR